MSCNPAQLMMQAMHSEMLHSVSGTCQHRQPYQQCLLKNLPCYQRLGPDVISSTCSDITNLLNYIHNPVLQLQLQLNVAQANNQGYSQV